jgi:hypothetical protein
MKGEDKIASLLLLCGACLTVVCAAGTIVQVNLEDIDSGTTSPPGPYRWLDVADQPYGESYRNTYNYTQAEVEIVHCNDCTALHGTLSAINLKPNFSYQLKLVGSAGTAANELIGLTGRWWQEQWGESSWINGQNLNTKGDGSSPNPNDELYFERRDVNDSNSPTGKHYKFTGYLVLGYFATDSNGNAEVDFKANSSYHVLWKTSQLARTSQDGPLDLSDFEVSLPHFAYDSAYPQTQVGVYGEWERLPVGGVTLPEGVYDVSFVLTEESFHGSGGTYAGLWAGAMAGPAEFTISQCTVDFLHFARFSSNWFESDCNESYWCSGADFDKNNDVNSLDLHMFVEQWLHPCPVTWPLK